MTTSGYLIQLIASLIVGATVLYMGLMIMRNKIQKGENIINNSIASAIFISSVLFSISFLLSATNQSFLSTLKILQQNANGFWMEYFKYSGLFLFITALTCLVIIYISFFIFSSIMKGVKGLEEIRSNNLAVSIITGIIIISLSLIVRENLIGLIESFIPYPTTPVVY